MVKNYISFIKYGAKNKALNLTTFFINLVILSWSAYDFAKSDDLYMMRIIVLLLLLWEVVGTFADLWNFLKRHNMEMEHCYPQPQKITISKKEQGLDYYVYSSNRNIALYSDTVNRFLQQGQDFQCVKDDDKQEQTEKFILNNFNSLLNFLKVRWQQCNASGVHFYNEDKLCLAQDITPESPLVVSKGNYYNTHLTNKCYYARVYTDTETRSSPLYEKYRDGIPSITESEMSNEIGVSTIGITSDGFIILLEQGLHANSSSNLIVPTGSGSADWADYIPESSLNTIIAATNRELCEEVGKSASCCNAIATTRVLGFYRWVNFGGKPEFLSVSKMNISLTEIFPSEKEQRQNKISKYIVNFPQKQISWADLDEFLNDLQTNERCSFPLYMNIQVLKDYINAGQEDLYNFLFQ